MKIRVFGSHDDEKIVNIKLDDRSDAGVILHEVNMDGIPLAAGRILIIKPDGIYLFPGYKGSLPTDSGGYVKIHLED